MLQNELRRAHLNVRKHIYCYVSQSILVKFAQSASKAASKECEMLECTSSIRCTLAVPASCLLQTGLLCHAVVMSSGYCSHLCGHGLLLITLLTGSSFLSWRMPGSCSTSSELLCLLLNQWTAIAAAFSATAPVANLVFRHSCHILFLN